MNDQNAACSSTESRICIKQFAFDSEIMKNIKIEKNVEINDGEKFIKIEKSKITKHILYLKKKE